MTLDTGQPFSENELWALSFGNGGSAGSTNTLYFTAGLANNTNGLFGAISSVPEPSSAVLGLIAMGVLAGGWRWKNRRRQREILIDELMADHPTRSAGSSVFPRAFLSEALGGMTVVLGWCSTTIRNFVPTQVFPLEGMFSMVPKE